MYAYGIRDDLLKWFENFLSSRTQAVTISGMLSDFLPITGGIIQGSMCGPQLFKLYINDLSEVIPLPDKVYLFADNTKLTKVIRTIADRLVLQAALCSAALWSALWQLTLNIIKASCSISADPIQNIIYLASPPSHVIMSKIWGSPYKQRLVVSQAYTKHYVSGFKEILHC